MSKALLGAHADAGTLAMLDEIRQLRARVAELEDALERAEDKVVKVEQRDDAIVLEPSGA